MKTFVIITSTLVLAGCASITRDSTQALRIDTVTDQGVVVNGAACTLSNDKTHLTGTSGSTLQVRRSAKDLDIVCTHPDYPSASGTAVSRANSGMWGNIVLGGAVGAIVDHNNGTAYTYPTWVQMVFGWVSSFDRRGETEGQPVIAQRISPTVMPVAETPDAGEPVPEVIDTVAPPLPADTITKLDAGV